MERGIKLLGFALVCLLLFLGTDQGWGNEGEETPEIKVEIRNNELERILQVKLGPFSLPAGSGHLMPPDLFFSMPIEGWLLSYKPRLVNDRDETLPNELLHHVDLFNADRRNFLCILEPELFFAAGSEMQEWPEVGEVGYRVLKGNRIRVKVMFHNSTDISFPRTYIEVRMTYRLLTDHPQLKNIYPAWIHIGRCGNYTYDLKPGENIDRTIINFPYSGEIIAFGGHLHDYGRELTLTNISRNEEILTVRPKLGPDGRRESIPIAIFPVGSGYKVTRGDFISVVATYNNPTGRILPKGAMGIFLVYFSPDHDEAFVRFKRNPK